MDADKPVSIELPVTEEAFYKKIEEFADKSDKNWIAPVGLPSVKLMVVMSHPPLDAVQTGDMREGPYYEEMRLALLEAGFKEKDFYLTSVVKFGIGAVSKPKPEHIEQCIECFNYEVETIKPKLIVTMGAEAFKILMRANKKVGSSLGEIVDSPFGKILPNYSPGMILSQDPKLRPFFREVFELAARYIDDRMDYTPFEYIVVDDPKVNEVIIADYISRGMFDVGYDAEWLGTKMTDDEIMYTFQYSCEPNKAIILNISDDGVSEDMDLLDTMKPLLEHPKVNRLGWNIRADDKRLKLRGFNLSDDTLGFDGMKAVAFIDSRYRKGLETGIKKFTNYKPYYNELNKYLDKHKISHAEMCKLKAIEPDVFYEYCAGDAVAHREACLNMKDYLLRNLTEKQQEYFFDVYLPLTHYFTDLELTGISIDQDVMEDITKKYVDKYKELFDKLQTYTLKYGFNDELLGKRDEKEAAAEGIYATFNPNSQPQKKRLLFEILNLVPAYYTKAGKSPKPRAWYVKQKASTQKLYSPSTNGKSLSTLKFELSAELEEQPDNPLLREKFEVVSLLLDLARVGVFANKFLSKQGTGFLDEEEFDEDEEDAKKSSYWAAICCDGKIHADFFECLSNFRSSSRVNVQNPASKVLSHIPDIFVPGYSKMTKEEQKASKHLIPRNIRHIFWSGHKDWLWSEVDVAGADLAIAAFCSQDPDYINDILQGNFHLKKAKEYFQDQSITKDDYSRYVSSKAITFRVAYTSELTAAALPIQAEIFAESGIHVPLERVTYALNTWNRYKKYILFREKCKAQVENQQCIDNLKGFRYHFGDTDDFGIKAGWMNESLAFPIASELALFLWDVSVKMKKQLVKEKLWMNMIKPVNSVHDASYWVVHKDLMKDNYFPELCKFFFTKECKISTGNNLGMEMVMSERWKGEEVVFHNETKWDFQEKCWKWKN